jgi:hypothetical protein
VCGAWGPMASLAWRVPSCSVWLQTLTLRCRMSDIWSHSVYHTTAACMRKFLARMDLSHLRALRLVP